MKYLFLLSFLFISFGAAAAEDRMTVEDLSKLCASKSDLDYGYCAGYITAVADGMVDSAVGEFRACNHAHIKSQQYIDLFKSYTEVFPDKMQAEAEITVAAMLARAFPCLQ